VTQIVSANNDGRTTVVEVTVEEAPDLIGTGIARCRPEDHFDEQIGFTLATARAMQHLCTQLIESVEEETIATVVSEKDYLLEPVEVVIKYRGEDYPKTMPRVAAEELSIFTELVLGARVTRS